MQSFGVKSGTEQPSLLLYGGWPRRFLSASVCSSLFSACSFFKNQKCDLCRPSRRGQLAAQRGATRRAPWAAHFLFENAFFTATFSLRKYFSKFVTFLRARSRLYRNRFLRVNVHIAAFFKLFKICILPAAGLCPLPPLPGRCWPDTIEGKNTTLFLFSLISFFFLLQLKWESLDRLKPACWKVLKHFENMKCLFESLISSYVQMQLLGPLYMMDNWCKIVRCITAYKRARTKKSTSYPNMKADDAKCSQKNESLTT